MNFIVEVKCPHHICGRNLEFQVSAKDSAILTDRVCIYCGIEFVLTANFWIHLAVAMQGVIVARTQKNIDCEIDA